LTVTCLLLVGAAGAYAAENVGPAQAGSGGDSSSDGSYDVNDHLQLSASIRNALDRAPPVSPYPNLPQPQFNGQYYDVMGRSYRAALLYRF
jgi:outer membrane receptor protein involved in Fe transport